MTQQQLSTNTCMKKVIIQHSGTPGCANLRHIATRIQRQELSVGGWLVGRLRVQVLVQYVLLLRRDPAVYCVRVATEHGCALRVDEFEHIKSKYHSINVTQFLFPSMMLGQLAQVPRYWWPSPTLPGMREPIRVSRRWCSESGTPGCAKLGWAAFDSIIQNYTTE